MNKPEPYTRPVFPWDIDAERRAWSRVMASCACALAEVKRGNSSNPQKILRANWPDDNRAALILKAAQSPTDTTNSGLLAASSVAMWRSLSPSCAAWRLFDHPSALRVDLSGYSTISLPNIASLPPAPAFVGEGLPAPVVMWAFGATPLGPAKKILILSTLSEELEYASPESAAGIIGRVLSDATARSIDIIAFDTVAGDDIRPPGLLHGVPPITASAATDPFMAMAEDLSNLVGAIGGSGIDPTDTVFVAAPREAMMITLLAGAKFNNDVLMSLGLPAKTVVAVAPAGIASAYQGPPKIETSFESVVHSEDTAPAANLAGATPLRSFYQTQVIGVKVRAMAAWAAAPGAVQVVGGVAW